MRCDVYTRLSRDREDQTSTTRQRRDCTRLIEAKGWTVARVHEDVDFSAYRKGVRRPAYEELVERVKAREVDAVVIWKIDRLSRSLREFLRFADLCDQHGVALVSVNEPFDTSSPIGRAITQVLAVFAELESATIGMRVRSAREFAAAKGLPSPGGRRMYGYTHQMAIVPDEAAVIRDAAERILAGASAYSIAKDWNEAGRKTVGGGTWSAAMLLRMLRNPILAGRRVYKGEVIGDGTWEPILELAQHQRLVSARVSQSVKRRTNLLTGVLWCEGCGERMVGHRARGRRVYKCPKWPPYSGCGRTITAEPVEAWVTELTFAALDEPEVTRALQAGRKQDGAEAELLRELEGVEQRMADLGEDYAAGMLPRKAFVAAAEALKDESDALQRRLSLSGSRSVLQDVAPLDVPAEWERRGVDWQASIVAAVFERIEVKAGRPGARFDPERVVAVPLD